MTGSFRGGRKPQRKEIKSRNQQEGQRQGFLVEKHGGAHSSLTYPASFLLDTFLPAHEHLSQKHWFGNLKPFSWIRPVEPGVLCFITFR